MWRKQHEAVDRTDALLIVCRCRKTAAQCCAGHASTGLCHFHADDASQIVDRFQRIAVLVVPESPAIACVETLHLGAEAMDRAGLATCSLATQPAAGATGPLVWTFNGSLAPGASGSVSFTVTVQ